MKTRVSRDAGSFICEFQFYSALAELYRKQRLARVVFVHTRRGTAEKDIQDCAMVVEAYIKALVEQSGL
jgi:pyroglutamyl-peptidase